MENLPAFWGRKKFFEPEPFEMAFIPAGNFMMGPSDQDAVFAMNSYLKVSYC